MSAPRIELIFGGAAFMSGFKFTDDASILQVYDVLEQHGVKRIDTGLIYGDSEARIGGTEGAKRFIIDTKTPGGLRPGTSTSTGILEHIKESLEKLKTDKLDVYYIHVPDASLDLEDMLKGIGDAHKAGYFERFGLSNFLPGDVERVHSICKEKGYPLPTVYQGSYSPVGRKPEKELLPVLRKLGIAYYVYSPLAGGFLTKTKEGILEGGENAGRLGGDTQLSQLYQKLFNRPAYLDSLALWSKAAEAAGCTKAELGYRWVTFDSVLDAKYGDGIILGASDISQITQTLEWLKKGSVGEEAKRMIDEVWRTVENEAQLDNFNE